MPYGYDIIQTSSCVNSSCPIVFTDFPKNSDLYNLLVVAKNHSVILKEFNLTIGKYIIKLRYNVKVNTTCIYSYHYLCSLSQQTVLQMGCEFNKLSAVLCPVYSSISEYN